ncbi:hypothetical protein SBOR_8299 [Sclerotinia borealis F-4128]|uniref:Uncharacterized protein n=1 Tax=Sclerotinia borealis (strain F-4128) TaxID=1432307 RepID=W9C902_SCLBF|nr:hypothetical protein SBOR_8299 [Sclerotinia borealis F-4128]
MAQNSSDRLSKIPKLKVPTSTPTDPSQPNHSRSRNLPGAISTAGNKEHHHHEPHHPHHGFIHPSHDSTLFSPTNTSSSPSNLILSEAPGVIPPFTSPTFALPHSQPFSDQDTPSGTEDAAGLGAPPNLASDLEEALMEEVEKNPGLTQGLRIEELAQGGEGGSNLTPGEVGTEIDIEVDAGVGVGVEDEDEITWESDSDDDEGGHEGGEKDEEYVASSSVSDSEKSSDSGFDGTFVARNPDTNMDTGPEYDERFVNGRDGYDITGVDADTGAGGAWNEMSNDIDVDPYSVRPVKVPGVNDVQMGFGGVNGDSEWNGVEALEPEEDEAVDGYEGTGDGVQRHSEDDVWW